MSIAPVMTVAIAEPRGGKAWPKLFVGRQSLPSRCGPIPRFPGALGRVRSYSTGGGLIGAACKRFSSCWFNCLAMLPPDRLA